MQTTTETITPAQARAYLANQARNRGVSKSHVQNFEVALVKSLFYLSPQGISFDRHGRLRDGQHRLEAVVNTGISAVFRVHRDCTEEELRSLDHGRSRSVADGIIIDQGDKSAHSKVAVIRLAASIGCSHRVRVDAVAYQHMAEALGLDHMKVICEVPRGAVPAPAMLSLVYARPAIPPGTCELLLDKLRNRETVLTFAEGAMFGDSLTAHRNRVLESMVGILGEKLRLHHNAREASFRLMRGVMAFVEGESVRSIKVSGIGYEWITERRQRINLPSLSEVVPRNLRARSRPPRDAEFDEDQLALAEAE